MLRVIPGGLRRSRGRFLHLLDMEISKRARPYTMGLTYTERYLERPIFCPFADAGPTQTVHLYRARNLYSDQRRAGDPADTEG